MHKDIARALVALGLLLAVGLCGAAWIVGAQAKHMAAGRQSISVKGLAEKPIQADSAQWSLGLRVEGDSFATALATLRSQRPVLDGFLQRQGFAASAIREGSESVEPNMVSEYLDNGQERQVQRGYLATQELQVSSRELARITAASKAALQLQVDGHPVFFGRPLYLVSNLEQVKMSLIGAATQNARQRAEEFSRHGEARVGAMRSASQGAFYILAAGSNAEANDYGGTYDKSTIDKLARVVVTVEYGITQ